MNKLNSILLACILIAGCGGGSSSSNDGDSDNSSSTDNTSSVSEGSSSAATGTIILVGDDTVIVGTQLSADYVVGSLADETTPQTIYIAPKFLSDFDADDVLNGFVIIVFDDNEGSGLKGISMSITVDGEKYSYGCSLPAITFVSCGTGSIIIDVASGTATLKDAKVSNISTGTLLSLSTILTGIPIVDDVVSADFSDSDNSDDSNNNGDSNGDSTGTGELTNVVGVWKDTSLNYYTSNQFFTAGFADITYIVFREDGINKFYGYYEAFDCYDYGSEDEYKDLGDGFIAIEDEDAYHYAVSGDNLTITYQGDSYVATKSNLTELDFKLECDFFE